MNRQLVSRKLKSTRKHSLQSVVHTTQRDLHTGVLAAFTRKVRPRDRALVTNAVRVVGSDLVSGKGHFCLDFPNSWVAMIRP